MHRHGIDVDLETEEWFPDFANLRASLAARKRAKKERKLRRQITLGLESIDAAEKFALPEEYQSEMTSRSGSFDSGDIFTDDERAPPVEQKAGAALA